MDLIHKRSISNFTMMSMAVFIGTNIVAGSATAEKPLSIESSTQGQTNSSLGDHNQRVANAIAKSLHADGLSKRLVDVEIRFSGETATLTGIAKNGEAILRASELTRNSPAVKTVINRIRLESDEPVEVVLFQEPVEERERAERREIEERERRERAEMEARERRELREREEHEHMERREHAEREHNPLEQVEKLHRAADALHEAGMHREADELHHRAEQMERAFHEHQERGEHHPPAEHLQHELMGNLKEIHHAIHALRQEVAQMREEMHHLRMQLHRPQLPEPYRPTPPGKKFTQPKPPQPEPLKAVPKRPEPNPEV